MRKWILALFVKTYGSLTGKGLGRIPLVSRIADFIYTHSRPKGDSALIEVSEYKIYVNPLDLAIPRQLIMCGYYEKFTTDLFKKIVKQDDVVIDIGANIGHYSLIAAKCIGESGKVYAFEPAPDNFKLLEMSVKENGFGNVTCLQKAVSDKAGTTRLFLNSSDMGQHAIFDINDSGDYVEIETITLDEYFTDKDKHVDVLKMDVEGAEMLVMQGMQQILEASDDLVIFTEFSPPMLSRAGCEPREYLNMLTGNGFELYHLDEQAETLIPISIDNAMEIGARDKWINFLCIKSNSKRKEMLS